MTQMAWDTIVSLRQDGSDNLGKFLPHYNGPGLGIVEDIKVLPAGIPHIQRHSNHSGGSNSIKTLHTLTGIGEKHPHPVSLFKTQAQEGIG